jgi:micrococcal nuclease
MIPHTKVCHKILNIISPHGPNHGELLFVNYLSIMYQYKAKVLNVVDGDTIDVEINLGFDITTIRRIRIIANSHPYFDTPETWRPTNENEKQHGLQATQRANQLLLDKTITLESLKKGKFHYVAKIKLNDDTDYGDLMINEGFLKKDSY